MTATGRPYIDVAVVLAAGLVTWAACRAWRSWLARDAASVVAHYEAMDALRRDHRHDMALFDRYETVGADGMTAHEQDEFRAMVRRIDARTGPSLDDWPRP